jgi:DNA-binding NtrC family response regulator
MESAENSPAIDGLIGESDLMREVKRDTMTAASLDLRVIIVGEPGTGKELIARGIHDSSGRRGRPFVTFNCVGIDPGFLERKLFGYEKGAFTMASARRLGQFEKAKGGTLFLDEIGELTRQSQAILSRVLQEGEFMRVGGTEAIKVDTRLVVATNRNLLREVEEGRFQRGLYDLLRGYLIRTPSLREHPADIPILFQRYFPSIELQEEALEMLCRYSWPGNVRQLRSMVERLAAKAGSGQIITTNHVRREIDIEEKMAPSPGDADRIPELREGETLMEYIGRITLAIYETERTRLGSHSAAARRLGMKRTTLYDWLKWARQYVTK